MFANHFSSRVVRWLPALGASALFAVAASSAMGAFTPLTQLPAPRVVSSSDSYPGDGYKIAHFFDSRPQTEYASNGNGTGTIVEMQFPNTVRIGALRHLDRNDPATVAASELIFLDSDGKPTQTIPVTHVDKPAGVTFFVLPNPVSAQRLRWRVTKLGPKNFGTVGGAEITFFAAGAPEPTPARDTIEARVSPLLQKDAGPGVQTIKLTVQHPYAEPTDALLRIDGSDAKPLRLISGPNTLDLALPAVQSEKTLQISLDIAGKTIAQSQFTRKPVSPLTVYILPHSHTDIGYTAIQTDIEKRQVQNLIDGIAHARRTATYPPGARFVWNVEVLWASDLYMRRLNDQQRADFLDAVKKGQVILNGMYLNELTGLCRPEELIRLFRCSPRFR